MKNAETVTFGGAGFDRADQLRKDANKLAQLLDDPDSRVLPVWRGKPLMCGSDHVALAFLSPDHTVFDDAREAPVFLGMQEGAAFFARDTSPWKAPEQDIDRVGEFADNSQQRHPALPEDQYFGELRLNMAHLSARDAELAAMSVGVFAWHRNHRFCARCGEKSNISTGGWQRTCPACKAQHFPRTDPVVIMLITSGNKVLIGRSPHWPEGMYSLLAGFMEPGETIEAAVRREVFEETAVKIGKVGYLASQPWPFPSSLMIGCWGEALSEDITIDPTEIEDALWTSREEILEAWANKIPTLVAARKGSIAHFLIKNWLSDTLS
ncbi:MAG: NAD(+) diphosphatase [Alphaproteobacteria bacterium]|nr:NAD(+) diphosphatase [Alphaproteobacteria bacterium]